MFGLYLSLRQEIKNLIHRFARPGQPLPGTDYNNSVLVKLLGRPANTGQPIYISLCLLGTHNKASGIIEGWRDASANNASGMYTFTAGSGNSPTNSGAVVAALQTQFSGAELVSVSYLSKSYLALKISRVTNAEFNAIYFRGSSTNLDAIQLLTNSDVSNEAVYTGNGLGMELLGGRYQGDGSGLTKLDARNLNNLVPVTSLPLASNTANGAMTKEQHSKLGGIAAQATKNATDAHLLNRANHTGKQPISSVTGLEEALANRDFVVRTITLGSARTLHAKNINVITQPGTYTLPPSNPEEWVKLVVPENIDLSTNEVKIVHPNGDQLHFENTASGEFFIRNKGQGTIWHACVIAGSGYRFF